MDLDIVRNWVHSFCIGITGCIGSGKSSVSSILESRGYRVIYADLIAKDCYKKTSPVYSDLVSLISSLEDKTKKSIDSYLDSSKDINPSQLVPIFMENESFFDSVNRIIHPQVEKEFYVKCFEYMDHGRIIFYESALLIETGFYKNLKSSILVSCPRDIRSNRLKTRASQSENLFNFLESKQLPEEDKGRGCDLIIENNGSLKDLENKVDSIIKKI